MEVNKIYIGDSLEIMKKIPDNKIHIIITSPPYNVAMNYDNCNDKLDKGEYFTKMENILRECYRVLITGGKIAINLPSCILQSAKSKFAFTALNMALIMRKVGFIDREWITWIKMPRGELIGHSTAWGSWCSPTMPYLRDASEYIIVMDKEIHKRTDKKGKNDITEKEFLKYTSNCWYIPPEIKRDHPAPFPEELVYRLLKLYTWKDDLVLDPFVGSGTTCVVASKLGRNYIGIDISEKYVEMAIKRIEQQKKMLNGELFFNL